MAVRIWWDTSIDGYHVVVPFNERFVEALKRLVPSSDRSYESATKVWSFSERYFEPVKTLCEQFFRLRASVVTKAQVESAQAPPAKSLDDIIVEFVKLLSRDAIVSAYRRAALENHPDHGGSMEKMSRLNSLWARIESELFCRSKS